MAQNTRMAIQSTPSDPAVGVVAITGSAQTLATNSRGIYVSSAGDLNCTFADGSTATITGLLAGVVYPFSITAIAASGTTAAGWVLL